MYRDQILQIMLISYADLRGTEKTMAIQQEPEDKSILPVLQRIIEEAKRRAWLRNQKGRVVPFSKPDRYTFAPPSGTFSLRY